MEKFSDEELSNDTPSSCDVKSLQLAVEGEDSFNSIVQRFEWPVRGRRRRDEGR